MTRETFEKLVPMEYPEQRRYNRIRIRLRAYRKAFHRFLSNFEAEKAAMLLPRIKLMEQEEIEAYNNWLKL